MVLLNDKEIIGLLITVQVDRLKAEGLQGKYVSNFHNLFWYLIVISRKIGHITSIESKLDWMLSVTGYRLIVLEK